MPDADLDLAVPAVFFGAVGTAGQRCTSTRRLYLHRDIAPQFLERLQTAYSRIAPGDPLDSATLLGPLHTRAAVGLYSDAVDHLKKKGADILAGGAHFGDSLSSTLKGGNYVQPTIAVPKDVDPSDKIWREETFAPVLCAAVFDELEQAIEWNNAVPQGLSSSLWTRDLRNVGKWIGPAGSDTGIVNVNVGTSGAEIGAAFGGNKSTGWCVMTLLSTRVCIAEVSLSGVGSLVATLGNSMSAGALALSTFRMLPHLLRALLLPYSTYYSMFWKPMFGSRFFDVSCVVKRYLHADSNAYDPGFARLGRRKT
jgi:hypothetical protein